MRNRRELPTVERGCLNGEAGSQFNQALAAKLLSGRCLYSDAASL